jgi:alpha-mannosidase/mannosylglycerate hydrolase
MIQKTTISGAERLPAIGGAKPRIHYVVSSHWDREWYLSFQGFRYRLVHMLDRVLEHLRDERWTCFVMDGQVAPILDYLEVRPERRERVVALARAGRLVLGPWYTMPDERILSGEALIRNLLRGYRECRALGVEPMRYGYICDIFGHCAQTPQIFAGMGIRHAFVWRGTNDKSHPQVFRWRAPDGSEVLAHKASDDQSYSSARYFAFPAAGADTGDADWRAKARDGAGKWRADEDARANVPVMLMLEGWDHNVPRAGLPEALDELRAALPDAEIEHSDFTRFAADLEPYRERVPVIAGELAAPSRDHAEWSALIQGCMSSHVPMKQANARCETLLTRWAEPLSAWVAALGEAAPARGFLDVAWRYLLLNHPHDTICGCSIDQVHKDQEHRYDQARLIGDEVVGACLDLLGAKPDGNAKGHALTVVSASAVAAERVATIEMDYPHELPTKQMHGFPDDPIPCFDVLDERGERIEYQLHSYVRDAREQDLTAATMWGLRGGYRLRLSLPLRHEGIGARRLRIVPRERWYRAMGTQLTAPDRAENEHLAVRVAPSGAVEIHDKATGRTFADCCVFEDAGDAGDGWYHLPPRNDQRFLSTGFATGISVVADGPFVTTFRIEKRLLLPEAYDWIQRRRGDARREIALTLDVTLRKGARAVECEARCDNTVKDHRLRVLFASGVSGDDCFASQSFTILRRPRGADAATFDWKENDVPERDTQGIVGVDDAAGGLAILAGDGLHEAGVLGDRAGTIALTLMRAFRKTVRTPSDGRSQLLHPLSFRWIIAPFTGRADVARLWQELIAFHAGLRVHQARSDEAGAARWLARLRDGAAVISALKPAEDGDGVIVRVFNPTDRAVRDELTLLAPFTAVEVDHAEEAIAAARAQPASTALALELPPQRVRSYRVRFAGG